MENKGMLTMYFARRRKARKEKPITTVCQFHCIQKITPYQITIGVSLMVIFYSYCLRFKISTP